MQKTRQFWVSLVSMQSFKVSTSFAFCTTEEAGPINIYPEPTLKLMMKLGFCVHSGMVPLALYRALGRSRTAWTQQQY